MSLTPHSERSQIVKVLQVIDETVDAKSFVFATEWDYQPGQFVTLRIPSDLTGSVARSYSLYTSPFDAVRPGVTVKRSPGGYASNWLCDNLSEGDEVEVLPPAGAFVPESLDVPMLLLAAGSGITPIMSILSAALSQGSQHIVLLYANASDADTIFYDDISSLEASHPGQLTVIWWQAEYRGIPDADSLAAVLSPYHSRATYLCGRDEFMAACKEALRVIGTDRSLVHQEIYASLSGDAFADVVPHETTDAEAADAASVTVYNLGATFTIAWPRDRTLVDVLIAGGHDVPYSCQSGECATCICRLSKGTVSMDVSDGLDPEDKEDGYILGCQAKPTADELEVEY
ncbi:ferredoxin--NADP reductase [Tsukamurella sp. 8F]|uniref:ferredoxin--NADP reductase n=1 Tax=unclassified Tsukamurella TaxID=2633480 RepID=UPI0023B92B01|nr:MULTISPECIES: ferredoxin--NADP reductase [unclassified Tsukamurella]MDF0530836.1 ferredoxin--NADP reductase [Tsukamurella sp. 8J]MDF0588219.1 ferredoxin--NADP reductase [Tsukamurella sp. 8F]